jgi:hypothetical protein
LLLLLEVVAVVTVTVVVESSSSIERSGVNNRWWRNCCFTVKECGMFVCFVCLFVSHYFHSFIHRSSRGPSRTTTTN